MTAFSTQHLCFSSLCVMSAVCWRRVSLRLETGLGQRGHERDKYNVFVSHWRRCAQLGKREQEAKRLLLDRAWSYREGTLDNTTRESPVCEGALRQSSRCLWHWRSDAACHPTVRVLCCWRQHEQLCSGT